MRQYIIPEEIGIGFQEPVGKAIPQKNLDIVKTCRIPFSSSKPLFTFRNRALLSWQVGAKILPNCWRSIPLKSRLIYRHINVADIHRCIQNDVMPNRDIEVYSEYGAIWKRTLDQVDRHTTIVVPSWCGGVRHASYSNIRRRICN